MTLRILFRCGLVAAALSVTAAVWAAEGATVESIDNYVRLTDTVSTGGQPTPAQIFALAQARFRAVLNLREEAEFDGKAEAEAAHEAGLAYLRIPVRGADPRDRDADEFLRVTDDRANYPIFIHCASGNRVGAFWLIRRVLRDGIAFEAAQAEAQRVGLRSPTLLEFARAYVASHPASRK
ncbi:MAG TPA: sulfur transferase domain-containing protein [Thermoanaerobaculia bacterium]|jgi:uncharacterized protein (TIGR01244 family)